MAIARPHRLLVLYTELAPYVLACFRTLARERSIEVHIVRWPLNKEAPFELIADDSLFLYDRRSLSDEDLLALLDRLEPSAVMASGWVDKGYLAVCRRAKSRGLRSIMTMDTAWRGHWKQQVNRFSSRTWMHHTFSHAWVTGEAQAGYARRLGFSDDHIRSGFYSADTDLFMAIGDRLLSERQGVWPHRLLCVARYIPTKGQQLLCDVFAELCDAGKAGDWELDLVGTGEMHQQVMRSASGKHPRIHHLGFVQVDGMKKVVDRAGAFILPSTYEPWGVVVHEHACLGLPLLLSAAVGASERFLVEGESGFSFVPGDRRSMKAAIERMINMSDAQLRAMGIASRARGADWDLGKWAAVAGELIGA